MGLFDSIKKMFTGDSETARSGEHEIDRQEDGDSDPDSDPATGDTAGFDWDNDENGFFEAMLAIESEGLTMTSLTREQALEKYDLRDPGHFRDVKEVVYHHLIRKHGSLEDVMQRESNFRQGLTNAWMQGNVKAQVAGGGLDPVEGITLEKWAAINAAITQGASFDDLLRGNGISKARWDKARTEWEARMARDTTFAVATVYGNAFTAASNGKYAEHVKEANAARAANRDMTMPPPISMDQYFDILYDQSYATMAGKDPMASLKAAGLTLTDWVDLGTVMGYQQERTWAREIDKINASMKRAEEAAKAKYPGTTADVDIRF